MSEDLEKLIIQEAKSRSQYAFEKLVTAYEKIIYNISYRMFNNEEDAKDMTQEIFVKLYKNLDKFDENAKFSTWIYRIAVNACIDEIRKRKGKETVSINEMIELDDGEVDKQFAADEPTPENKVICKEDIKHLKEAIESLPENHKVLIILRDIQGYSYEEIADITESNLGTVKSRISRARNHLKNIIMKKSELYSEVERLKVR